MATCAAEKAEARGVGFGPGGSGGWPGGSPGPHKTTECTRFPEPKGLRRELLWGPVDFVFPLFLFPCPLTLTSGHRHAGPVLAGPPSLHLWPGHLCCQFLSWTFVLWSLHPGLCLPRMAGERKGNVPPLTLPTPSRRSPPAMSLLPGGWPGPGPGMHSGFWLSNVTGTWGWR